MNKNSRSWWLILLFFIGAIYLFDFKGLKFYLIPSDSMEPTLKRSDYVLGFSLKPSEIQRGDIAVFSTGAENDYYVKRVVGLPGEKLQIIGGFVYINGEKLDEPYVRRRLNDNFGPVEIPPAHVFLLGDNRPNSLDSRWYGPVPIRLLKTEITHIYNPIKRIGAVR